MLKKALLLAAIAVSLPTHAAEPQTVVLAWTLFHKGKEVDGYSFARVRLDGPYTYKNLVLHHYNKDSIHTGKKIQYVRGDIFSGVELSFKPHWASGVKVDYKVLQSHLDGFTKLPGNFSIEAPNQHLYEARGTSQPLAVGETELIRLTCNIDISVEQCPYYLALTIKQVN